MQYVILMCIILALSLSPVLAHTPASTQNKKTMENSEQKEQRLEGHRNHP